MFIYYYVQFRKAYCSVKCTVIVRVCKNGTGKANQVTSLQSCE